MAAILGSHGLTPASNDWLDHAGLAEGALQVARGHRRGANRLVEGLLLATGYFRSRADASAGAAAASAGLATASTPILGRFTRFKEALYRYLHPVDWEMERYLAGSSDCADLEHRMRTWARSRARF